MFTPEQAQKIKQQLFEQVNNFPEGQREQAIEYIDGLNEEELENFLIENNLIQSQTPENYKPAKCLFCSIVNGEIPGAIIDENSEALAILEINPISKAHALIVPKTHVETEEGLSDEAKALARRVYKKLLAAFKPKSIILANMNLLGHEVINLVPVYTNENLKSARKRATPEELNELKAKVLKLKVKIKKSKKKEEEDEEAKEKYVITETNTWLPVRIP